MGKTKGKERKNKERCRGTKETNDVSRSSKEDRSRATHSLGKSEGEESGLAYAGLGPLAGRGECLQHLSEDITLLMHGSASSVSFSGVDVNGHATDTAVVCLRGSGHAAPPVRGPRTSVTRQYNPARCASVQCRKDALISSCLESLYCSSRSPYPETWHSAAPPVPSSHWPPYAIPQLHGEGASKRSRYRACDR